MVTIFKGILMGISVSWFAVETIRENDNPIVNPDINYVFGVCLYLGWVSTAIALVYGLVMVYSTCCSQPVDHYSYQALHNYGHNPYGVNYQYFLPDHASRGAYFFQ